MRGILSSLQVNGVPLGDELASGYTPHSWRSFLVSAAGALGLPESETRWLSAWNAKGSDNYVRTSRVITLKIQRKVACALRGKQGDADVLGEGPCRGEILEFARTRGVTEDRIEGLRKQLTTIDCGSKAPEETDASAGIHQALLDLEGGDTPLEGGEPEPTTDLRDNSAEVRGYVSSLTGRRNSRRLHLVGRCPFRPGIHYLRYFWHGLERPNPEEYDAVCGRCWPTTRTGAVAEGNSSAPIEDESSSSVSAEYGQTHFRVFFDHKRHDHACLSVRDRENRGFSISDVL